MGAGDDILATGMAKGAAARGKKIAFGDGTSVKWGPHSRMIFANNPNVAWPGEERQSGVEWCRFYKGNRIYNRQHGGERWVWNYDFRAKPGEFFFTDKEMREFDHIEPDFIFIEPHIKVGTGTANKDWGFANYQAVVDGCPDFAFVQCDYGRPLLRNVHPVKTKTFREAVVVLRRAALAIVPEGGMHHAAAAVGVRAIVLFGGWAPPRVLGYESHVNLTGAATEWCGSYKPCDHCRKAMREIAVQDVLRYVYG